MSFLTRLHDEGYTEQIPRRLDLAYARARTRTADWGELPITWHPVPTAAFCCYDARRDGALEATPAKAAADLVHRQKAFGGLKPHGVTVRRALADASDEDLVEAVQSYSVAPGTVRRLIHLTTAVRTLPPSLSDLIADLDTHNPIPLDLTRRQGQPMGPMNVISTEADA